NAHNHAASALGMYRFLCAAQTTWRGAGWSWGALEAASFLPRVRHGRAVFARARWRVGSEVLKTLAGRRPAERYRAARAMREALGLPRWVSLVDGDNLLPVDLDQPLSVDSFCELVKNRTQAALEEVFPGPEDLPLTAEGRAF